MALSPYTEGDAQGDPRCTRANIQRQRNGHSLSMCIQGMLRVSMNLYTSVWDEEERQKKGIRVREKKKR